MNSIMAYLRELGREFRMIWNDARSFDLQAWAVHKAFVMGDEYRDRQGQVEQRAHEMSKTLPEPYYVIHSHLSAYVSPVIAELDSDFAACLDDGERVVRAMIENRVRLSGEGRCRKP